MKVTLGMIMETIRRSGIWLTLPPLILSFALTPFLPEAFGAEQFNEGVPVLLLHSENMIRLGLFALPVSFVIGVSSSIQKRGLALYLIGLLIYVMSYGAQIIIPSSAWSCSLLGFAAPAYSNIIWMTGLACMGKDFVFFDCFRYRPRFFIVPSILFVVVHTAHAAIAFML